MLEMVHGINFRSYADVKLEFGQHQVSVVCGDSTSDYADSNGTGKSSLMYLVLWTLFGKWPGMENADSCIRQPANKDCTGIVWITKPDGRWAVSRHRKDTIHGNNVFIQPPNHTGAHTTAPKLLSGDLKVMNERIEGLLGMNYDTFVRTMVFTGSESTTFALMTDKEQKKLLDTIVPLDFSSLHERAKEKEKYANEIATECVGVTKHIDDWIANNETALVELDHRRMEIEGEDEVDVWEKIHTLDEHLAVYRNAISSAEHERKALLPKIDAARAAIEEYRPTISAFEEAQERWAVYSASKEMLTRQESERKHILDGIDERLRVENHHKQEHSQGKTCRTCGQVLGQEAMTKAVESVDAEISRLGQQRLEQIKHYDHIQKDYIKRKTDTGFDDESWAKFKTDYDTARQHKGSLESAWQDLTSQDRTLADRIEANKSQIKTGEAVKADLEDALKPDTEALAQIAKDIERVELETVRLKRDREASASNQTKWHDEQILWNNVGGMFSGGKGSLQHFIFESMLPEMSATAQMFLSLFSKTELRVAFKSHKKKGSKVIEGFYIEASKGSQTGGYGDLSGGERRRLDFCIFLTLWLMTAKHVFSPKVLFLDEIADFMDDTGQQAVIGVLEFFCQQYGVSCLLLTNKRELVASVAHGYRCTMADGISTLVSVQET